MSRNVILTIAMKLSAALILFLSLPLFAAAKEAPVTLLVDADDIRVLKPSSAFEVRFAEPMVADDAVGKAGPRVAAGDQAGDDRQVALGLDAERRLSADRAAAAGHDVSGHARGRAEDRGRQGISRIAE